MVVFTDFLWFDEDASISDMDLGTFDLEMMGFRFAQEMGMDSETYCVPGSKYIQRKRNDYYVARAEGHNVYVINPDRRPGQQRSGSAKIERLAQAKDYVKYCIDMDFQGG